MDKDSLKKILEKQPHGVLDRYRLEKALLDRYGPEGVKVYLLVDDKRTAEEIMKNFGMTEERFIEMVTYMEETAMLKTEESKVTQPEVTKVTPPKPEEISPIPLIKIEESGELVEKESALEAMLVKEKLTPEKQPEAQQPVMSQPQELKEPPKPLHIPKTPMEKKLYEKFGDAGLHVYSLIDESKTPRHILRETGMGEEQLRAILEFMNSEGIIKLEEPHEVMEKPILKAPAPVPLVLPKQIKPVEAPPPKPVEKPIPRPLQPVVFNRSEVCIPTAQGLKLLTKLKIEAELLNRYGNEGVKAFSMMNGKRTNVKIIKEIKISSTKLDDITSFLLGKGALKLQCLTAENIREMYGEEGLAIYSKYKRDGIVLYELIDKKASLREIVHASGIEPKLAVEMFAFIHKVLGLQIPIDTELLYKQLGVKP
jgi:hypothetical protein